MKIIATSDWHLDASTAGYDRFLDVQKAVEETVADAIEWGADLYLFLGDLCDPDPNRNARCVAYAIEVAQRLAKERIRSRWMPGNHCVINDGSGTSVLEPMAAAAELIEGAAVGGPIGLYSRPSVELFMDELLLVALPYVPKAAHYDPAEFVMAQEAFTSCSSLVIGHLSVETIEPGSETTEMGRGRDLWLPIDAIAQRFPKALVLNGHYHRSQDGVVHVPGSLERLTFAEEQETKGWMRLESDPSSLDWTITRMVNKGARKLVTIDEHDEAWSVRLSPEDSLALKGLEGAIVRLRPPPDTPDAVVGVLLDAVKAGGAVAAKLLPAAVTRTPIARQSKEETAQRRSHREVALSLASAGGDALVEFCREIMDQEAVR